MNRFDGECWICTTQGGIEAKGDASILGDVADVGTAIFAPELLPVVAPAVGAVTGGIEGGGKGALIGGLEGAVAGQLGGTGDLAPLSDPTGGSFLNQVFTGAGDFLSGAGGGATGAAGDVGAVGPDISVPATTTATGAEVPGVTAGGGLSMATPATSLAAPPPALASTVGGGVPDLTAGGGLGSIDSSGLANVAGAVGGAGPSNVASDLPANFSIDSGAGLLNTSGGSLANPNATLADITGSGGSNAAPGFIDKLKTAATSPGAVLGALGLGYQALTAPAIPKGAQAPAITADQLALARQATAGATALEAPLTTGQLPPGAQSAIDQATKAAKARVISNYAARGMDTNPTTNSSLASDLNAIDQQAAGQVFQYADQLYQQGLSQAQISEGLYNAILQNTTAQNDTMSKAISNFVTAAAGGGRPTVNINTTGGGSAAAA